MNIWMQIKYLFRQILLYDVSLSPIARLLLVKLINNINEFFTKLMT